MFKKIWKYAFIPISLTYSLSYVFFKFVMEEKPFETYANYNTIFISITGIIFGILGVITFYYLGKFHDYSKEVIKVRSNMLENYQKFTFLIKMTFEYYKNKIDDEEVHEIKNKIEQKLAEKSNKIEKINNNFNEQKSLSQDIPLSIIKESLYIAFFLSLIIIMYFLNIHTPSKNMFYVTIIGVLAGVTFLIHGWFQYENYLKRLINILDKNYEMVGDLKLNVYELEKEMDNRKD